MRKPLDDLSQTPSRVHGADDVRAWLSSPHPQLGGHTPADALEQGAESQVLAMLQREAIAKRAGTKRKSLIERMEGLTPGSAASLLGVVGVVLYGAFRYSYSEFYEALGATPEEAGYDSVRILAECLAGAIIAAMFFAGAYVVAIGPVMLASIWLEVSIGRAVLALTGGSLAVVAVAAVLFGSDGASVVGGFYVPMVAVAVAAWALTAVAGRWRRQRRRNDQRDETPPQVTATADAGALLRMLALMLSGIALVIFVGLLVWWLPSAARNAARDAQAGVAVDGVRIPHWVPAVGDTVLLGVSARPVTVRWTNTRKTPLPIGPCVMGLGGTPQNRLLFDVRRQTIVHVSPTNTVTATERTHDCTILLADGFERGSLSGWQSVHGLRADSEQVPDGVFHVAAGFGTGPSTAVRYLRRPSRDLLIAASIRADRQTTTWACLLTAESASGKPIARVCRTRAGKVALVGPRFRSAVDHGPRLSGNLWHYVELRLRLGKLSRVARVRVDDEAVPGLDVARLALPNEQIARIRLGDPDSIGGRVRYNRVDAWMIPMPDKRKG